MFKRKVLKKVKKKEEREREEERRYVCGNSSKTRERNEECTTQCQLMLLKNVTQKKKKIDRSVNRLPRKEGRTKERQKGKGRKKNVIKTTYIERTHNYIIYLNSSLHDAFVQSSRQFAYTHEETHAEIRADFTINDLERKRFRKKRWVNTGGREGSEDERT